MKIIDVTNMNLDDAMIVSLRQCGHYLHHSAAAGKEGTKSNAELAGVLTEEEKKQVVDALQKCLKAWEA